MDYVARLETMIDDADLDDGSTSATPRTSEDVPVRGRPRRTGRRGRAVPPRPRHLTRSAAGFCPFGPIRCRPRRSVRQTGERTSSNRVGNSSPLIAANAIGAHHSAPAVASGRSSGPNQPTSRHSSGCRRQSAAHGPAEEHEHVHAETGEAHPLAVDHRQHPLAVRIRRRSPRRPPSPPPRPVSSRRRPIRSGTARSPSRRAGRAAAGRRRCPRSLRSPPSA